METLLTSDNAILFVVTVAVIAMAAIAIIRSVLGCSNKREI